MLADVRDCSAVDWESRHGRPLRGAPFGRPDIVTDTPIPPPLGAAPSPMATAAKPASRINWRIVRLALAVFGLTLCSSVTVAVSPFINGAMMDQRLWNGLPLNDAQAGMIRTAEILTFATLTIFISARIRLFQPRLLGLFGVSMILIGNVAATLGAGVMEVVLARMCHAVGAACAMSAASAFIVRAPNPQRISGGLVLPGLLVSMTAVLAAGAFATYPAQALGPFWTAAATALGANPQEPLSQLGVFGAVGIVAVFALILVVIFAPKGQANATDQPAFSSMLGALRSPYVIGCAVVFFGSTAVWQSFRQIGLTHGFDPQQVGQIIIGVNLLGALFGASMALVKLDWLRPALLTALALYGIATTITPLAPSGATFIAAYMGLSLSYLCITVLLAAIGARLDRTGGLNAAGLGWQALINATAPYVGGAIVTNGGGYPALAVLCVIASLIALPAFWLATQKLSHLAPAIPDPR
jgi:hypothetical protein